MMNRYLLITLLIIILPVTQLFPGTSHSYVLSSQEMLIDYSVSPDISPGGNDQPDKSFIPNLFLIITLFLTGSHFLFTAVVMLSRKKRLLTPVFYQSNFVI